MNKFNSLHPNIQGALWMIGSALSFVCMTAVARYLGDKTSVAMMIFWRSIAGVIMTLPFILGKNASHLKAKRPIKIIHRSVFTTAGFFGSFYAFANLPMAQAQALSFSRTLFITILAVIILHEKVAWRRWTAVAIGFAGVILMTKPDFNGGSFINFASLAAVGAAACFAFSIVTAKDLTKDHSPMTLVLYSNLFTTFCGLPFLLMDFHFPSLSTLLPLAGLGFFGVMAQNCYVRALSVGEASLMGLMDYIRLPLSAAMGYIIFMEKPDINTILGAIIVIGSTLYITFRELKLGTQKPDIAGD